MADNGPSDSTDQAPDDPDADLRSRLVVCWQDGAVTEFYATLMALAPRVEQHLRAQHRLCDEDIDDCLAVAYERMHPRLTVPAARAAIADPYNYFFTIAVRVATDLHRHESRWRRSADSADDFGATDEADATDTLHGSDSLDVLVAEDWAVTVVEDAADDTEVDASWAVPVIRAAIARLPPMQRQVIGHLADQGFDGSDFVFNSQDALAALGMTPAAFRKAKSRAYVRLRQLIPELIEELGIVPPKRLVPAIFPDRTGEFPTDD